MIDRLVYRIYESRLLRKVKNGSIPEHIAIIMDGNRRFARKMGLEPHQGHFFGSKKAEEVLEWCWELGVRMLTLYAFSTENFRRSEREKQNIFVLLEKELRRILNDRRTYEREMKVRVVGRRELLPDNLLKTIEEVENATKRHGRHFLNIAIAYGGRQEILDAVRKILHKVKAGKLRPESIDRKVFEEHLYGDGKYSQVDLVIRTGGEQRLSNFLPWQTANSVAYFCDVYWPEFRKIDLLRAIRAWQYRKRQEGV
ncbi:polyprenyl diphosphate synthase [Archaeoglobus neptunius]|uniref:polyprenyl diphosphate synthase n=1 Tax=Archaeoglobus neptunius TaxID=2798580 RepID=UPI00192640B8|nr:polyprenyl diphosphate synthase [Archaeoglobus neptunius]